ncbi:hypothetical protein DDT52_09050 [Brenneria roseae subsp. roseae]|uniref:hypothetical protein n=1 Tax=Brenneria roseae TaxID=1509241 RepID=UPI000D606C1F|nr:hypothetical protein [Brenneria roseae]PWC20842.1 hypothetical protein DDT52_09050 [Brenneria roseae subsp. roseae]
MSFHPPLRLLEVNTPLIWHWPHFLEIMAVIDKYHFNGLIIHQQNMLALLARPSLFSKGPGIENLNHERESTLSYLQRISDYCQSKNIQLWIQGEAFPNDAKIKQKFPEFFLHESSSGGSQFLNRFYSEILDEVIAALPDISGMILSLQIPEFHTEQWKDAMKTLHRCLRRRGKKLVLRDYTDDSWPRRQLQTTLNSLPNDVRVSLKATALGYRPGFANNPDLADFKGYKKWVEFDLWGIDYGWTLLPCMLVDEIQGRLSWAHAVAGDELEAVSARISWEWLSNSSLLESINEVNLFGLSQIACQSGENLHASAIFHRWLMTNGVDIRNRVRLETVQTLFFSSYDWMCKTPYFLGRLLHHHSQIPLGFEHAMQLLHAETRSANWAQSFQPLFPVDDPGFGESQRQLITLECQQMLFFAQHLRQSAREIQQTRLLPEALSARLSASWEYAWRYTGLFNQTKQLIADRLYIENYGPTASRRNSQLQQIGEALRFASELQNWLLQHRHAHPHFLTMLMTPERLNKLAESCRLAD